MGKRLFVGVDLPDEFTEAVAAVQESLSVASGLDVTDPAQAHVTLKFLGDTPPQQIDEVRTALSAAVEAAGVEPFPVTYGGLGVFPSLDYISVVWLGVEDGGEELTHLHEAVETRTVELGYDPETHEFTPHVTLARMKHAGGKDHVQQVVTEQSPTVGTTTVDAIALTESELGPDGPTYSTVERFEL